MRTTSILLAVLMILTAFCGCTENEKEDFGFITLSKCTKTLKDDDNISPNWDISWENLALSESDAAKYPALAEALDKMNESDDSYSYESANSFKTYYNESYDEHISSFYENTEHFVLRADKQIVSIRGDFSTYSGGVHGYYSSVGINLDPQTGKEVELSDIIVDKQSLYKYVFESIMLSHPEEIYEERRESIYEMLDDSAIWTIDYQKLTVYFNPYAIASYAAGLIKVDVWFDEHPQLFNAEYTKAPSSHAIELAYFEPYTFDMDKNDGKRDTIMVGCHVDEQGFDCGTIVADINENEYTEDNLNGTSLTSFLVCIDGEYFLYTEVGEDNGKNSLHIYKVEKDGITKIDKVELGFKKHYDPGISEYGGYYREITNNPCSMNLETYFHMLDSKNTAYKNYSANKKTALPESDQKLFFVNADNHKKQTLCDIELANTQNGEKQIIPKGTVLTLTETDCKSFVDALDDNGNKYRIDVQVNNDGNTVNGIDVYECFTDVPPTQENETVYEHDAQLSVVYTIYEEETVTQEGLYSAPSNIELMQFHSEKENFAIDSMNQEINTLYQEYLYNYCYSDEEWCDFLAWPTFTDRYLNAVVTYISYPTYGTSGNVASWVYDKVTGDQYTLEQALIDAGMTEQKLLHDFNVSVKEENNKAVSINSLAFRMLDNGKPQFIAGVEIEYFPSETWVSFMTWTDGKVELNNNIPFSPSDVTADFAGNPLYCHTLYEKYMLEDDAVMLTFAEASDVLREIYDVKEALDSGMILLEKANFAPEYIDGIPHRCIEFATEYPDSIVIEKVYAVAPNSVYEYNEENDSWSAVGFG